MSFLSKILHSLSIFKSHKILFNLLNTDIWNFKSTKDDFLVQPKNNWKDIANYPCILYLKFMHTLFARNNKIIFLHLTVAIIIAGIKIKKSLLNGLFKHDITLKTEYHEIPMNWDNGNSLFSNVKLAWNTRNWKGFWKSQSCQIWMRPITDKVHSLWYENYIDTPDDCSILLSI